VDFSIGVDALRVLPAYPRSVRHKPDDALENERPVQASSTQAVDSKAVGDLTNTARRSGIPREGTSDDISPAVVQLPDSTLSTTS